MATQSEYRTDFTELLATKPADANITGQTAVVGHDGTVSISFSSADASAITSLRNWLTTIIGS